MAKCPSRLLCICLVLASGSPLSQPNRVTAAVIADPTWGGGEDSRGIGVKIFDLLASSTNLTIDAEAIPMQRLTRALQAGEVDYALLPRSDEFDVQSERLCKVGSVQLSLALLKTGQQFRTLHDLEGRQYARLRGGQHIDSHPGLRGLSPYPVSSMYQGFRMLSARRVAGVVCVEPGCHRAIKSAGMHVEQFNFLPIESLEIHLYATRRPRIPKDFAATTQLLKKYCNGRDAQQRFSDLIAPPLVP